MSLLPTPLLQGYRSFVEGRYLQETQRYRTLAREGQAPETMVIACCDSRAAPETIFGAGAGELFVARNVANLVPPYNPDGEFHGTSAALEFAVQALKVKHIVVLGHATCGGIKAAGLGADPLSSGNFIGRWVSLVQPATKTLADAGDSKDKEGYLTRLEYTMIGQSLENLMTFDFIREAVEAGKLQLHGAHFGIETGELRIRDPKTGEFESVVSRDGQTLAASALIGCTAA